MTEQLNWTEQFPRTFLKRQHTYTFCSLICLFLWPSNYDRCYQFGPWICVQMGGARRKEKCEFLWHGAPQQPCITYREGLTKNKWTFKKFKPLLFGVLYHSQILNNTLSSMLPFFLSLDMFEGGCDVWSCNSHVETLSIILNTLRNVAKEGRSLHLWALGVLSVQLLLSCTLGTVIKMLLFKPLLVRYWLYVRVCVCVFVLSHSVVSDPWTIACQSLLDSHPSRSSQSTSLGSLCNIAASCLYFF